MATTTNDGSGATAVTSWTNTANAYDGSATTYANPVGAVTTHVLDITGYDFATPIPADALGITSIVVNVQDYVSNAARFNAPTIRAYDGATPLGTGAFTLTQRTVAGSENATLPGTFSVAAVRSAGFKITYSLTQTSTASSPTANFGWANVTVNYTVLVNQAVTAASVTSTAILASTRIFPQILASTTAATASLRRVGSKVLLDTVSATATVSRSVTKTITDTVSVTGTLGKSLLYMLAMSDTVTASASMLRTPGLVKADTVTTTAPAFTFLQNLVRTLSDTVTTTGTATKRPARTFSGSASASAVLTRIATYRRTLASTSTSSVTTTKAAARRLSDTVTATGVMLTQPIKLLFLNAASVVSSANLVRRPGKIADATVQTVSSLPNKWVGLVKSDVVTVVASAQKSSTKSLFDAVTSIGILIGSHVRPLVLVSSPVTMSATARRMGKKNLARVVTTTTTMRKKTTKTVLATSTSKVKFGFQFAWKKTMTATVGTTATAKKFIRTTKKATLTPTVTFRRFSKRVVGTITRPKVTFEFRQSLKRTLQDSVTTQVKLSRGLSKSLTTTASVTAGVRKVTGKGISTTSSVLGSMARLFIQGTGWIQWNGPDQQPTPLELLGMWDGTQIVPLTWTGEEVN